MNGFLPLFLRQFALTLAALCLTLQAAAPAGFMFVSSDKGFPLAVVLCTGDGPVSVALAPTVTRAALAIGANAPPPSRAPPFIA